MDFPFTEISVKELGLETKISFSSIKSKAKEMGLRLVNGRHIPNIFLGLPEELLLGEKLHVITPPKQGKIPTIVSKNFYLYGADAFEEALYSPTDKLIFEGTPLE